MDVGDASTSLHYAQATHKKERLRKLGYVDSTDPRTIRQVSLQNSPTTPILIVTRWEVHPEQLELSPSKLPFFGVK